MLSNWRNWCRLCANTEALFKIDSRSDMLQTVQKYFMLTVCLTAPTYLLINFNNKVNYLLKP